MRGAASTSTGGAGPRRRTPLALMTAATLALGGCGPGAEEASGGPDPSTAAPTNRIAVPPPVRRNLGITFARVERRPVERTLRLPGWFELRPDARRALKAPLPGRVELLVEEHERVVQGQLLLRIDSPRWQELRHEVVEAEGEIKLALAQLAVALATAQEAREALDFLDGRLRRLRDAASRQVDLEARRVDLESSLPRLDAKVAGRRVELDEAREHLGSLLKVAASVTGIPVARLVESVEDPNSGESGEDGGRGEAHHDRPRWRTLDTVEVRAAADGVVVELSITPGAWVEAGEFVLQVVDPRRLRLRADAPQGDLARLRDGLAAWIAPPQGGGLDLHDAIAATLRVGVEGDPAQRTMPVYGLPEGSATWARPGVAAWLEVVTDGGERAELAIPTSSLVRDGLRTIYFRRDPRRPDQVIPIEADLGPSDGRWVAVYSGITDGDEVVLEGAYALTLAGGRSQAPPGYHYHADGALHRNH